MFYVQIGANGLDIRVKITDDNVFTDCKVCGRPTKVRIATVKSLCPGPIYCADCHYSQMNRVEEVQNGT